MPNLTSGAIGKFKKNDTASTRSATGALSGISQKQQNVQTAPRAWDGTDLPSRGDIFANIRRIASTDKAAGEQAAMEFSQLMNDPTSPYYRQYGHATNQAVQNLQALGFDTSVLNDGWFAQNDGWIRSHLNTSSTTNTPSSSVKKKSWEEQVAYQLYQYQKSEAQTKQAESEMQAAMKEAKYWTNFGGRNYSDQQVYDKVREGFEKKYPTLAKMESEQYRYAPLELNRAVDWSDDVIMASIWQARNPEYNGGIEGALAAIAMGEGNQWQENQEITALLNPNDSKYQPYAVGGTMDKAFRFFGITEASNEWIEENSHLLYDGTPEEQEAMKNLIAGNDFTNEAEEAISALDSWIESKKGGWTSFDKAKRAFDELLAGKKIKIGHGNNRQEIDISALNKLDATIGKDGKVGTAALVPTTRALNYKYADVLDRIQQIVDENTKTPGGMETLNQMQGYVTSTTSDYAKAQEANWARGQEAKANAGKGKQPEQPANIQPFTEDQIALEKAGRNKIMDAADVVEDIATEDEQSVMRNAGSPSFDLVRDNITVMKNDPSYVGTWTAEAQQNANKQFFDTNISNMHDVALYLTAQQRVAEDEPLLQEFESKYGDITLYMEAAGKGVPMEETVDIGEGLHAAFDYDEQTGRYELRNLYDDQDNNYALMGDMFFTPSAEYGAGYNRDGVMAAVGKEEERLNERARGIQKAAETYATASDEEKQYINSMRQTKVSYDKNSQYVADNEEDYKRQMSEIEYSYGYLEMLKTSAEWMGQDTSTITEMMEGLQFATQFYDEPQLVCDSNTKLMEYDAVCAAYGVEPSQEDRMAYLKGSIESVDAQIADINKWLKYYETSEYTVPDNVIQNMKYKLEDLEYDRKAYEYGLMMTETDPSEMERLAKLGDAFYNKGLQILNESTGAIEGDQLTFEEANSYATEQERQLFYYLIGKSLEENGISLENADSIFSADDTYTDTFNKINQYAQAANEYVEHMDDPDHGAWTSRMSDDMRDTGEDLVDQGFVTGALANAAGTALTPVESLASAYYILDRAVNNKRINPKSGLRGITVFKESTRAATFESIDEYYKDDPVARKLARLGFEIYSNRGDSMMNALAFGWMFPGGEGIKNILSNIGGATPMGFTAALTAAAHAVERGASMEDAWKIAGVTFIAETFTEGITYSNIKDALGTTKEITKESVKGFFKEWLTKEGLEEMIGESINELAENAADMIVMGDASEHQASVDKYMSEGYSKDEAETMTRWDEVRGVLHTAIVSYLSAGTDVMVKAGKAAVNSAGYYATVTRALQQNGYQTSMVEQIRNARQANKQALKNAGDMSDNTSEEQTAKQETESAKESPVAPAEGESTAAPENNIRKEAATDIVTLEKTKKADLPAQTAALASVLDIGKGDTVSSDANAAAVFMTGVMGEDATTIVQQVLLGAGWANVDQTKVKQALQNAALGNGLATALVQTDTFKNANAQQKAQMLVDTLEQDNSNPNVRRNVSDKVRTFNQTMNGANQAAVQGLFDQAAKSKQDAQRAAMETAQAEQMLDEANQKLEAAKADVQQKSDAVVQNPSDDNVKQHADAVTKMNSTAESQKQMEQHLDNQKQAQQEKEAKARKDAEDAMNASRQTGEQAVNQMEQQKADEQAALDEQERLAKEAEQQRQAEEDERTGKAQEAREDAAIEQAVAKENVEGVEAENLADKLKERKEKIKMSLRDLKKPVSSAEGYLAIAAFERKLGIKINLEDMGPITPEGWTRGKYSNGVITLNQNMTLGQALVEAALHEITHSMKNTNSYKTYRDVVLNSVFGATGEATNLYNENEKFRAKVDQTITDREKAGDPNFVGKSKEKQIAAAEEEIIADFARFNLAEKDVVQRFMDAGMGGRMRNMLHNINQALKNYFSNMSDEERKTAEYLRRAERAFQKAMDEVAKNSVHPEGDQFSIMQIAQATGMTFNEETLQLFDKDGNEIDGVNRKITPDMIKETPVGMLIDNGLKGEQRAKASEMMAGLMNMVARYKDSNLVWEIGATTLSSTFSALKSNSDPQYKTTVDFGTVCAKTQAIIDTLSQVMLDRVKEGKYGGLDRKDIMKVYDAVNQAGLSVPYPVCYVFSRWMGVPSLLGQMSQYQHDYVALNEDGSIDKKATQKNVDKYIKTAEQKYGDAKAINNQKTKLQNKLVKLEEKRIDLEAQKKAKDLTEEQKTDLQNQLNAVLDEQVAIDKQLGEVNAYNWITQALCKKDKKGKYVVDDKFQLTPDDILFDLNRTGDFAGYEKNWKYRNTRGAGMGKAIMPYSGESIGDILYGVKKNGRQSTIKNPWLNMDSKAAAKQLREAQARAIKQNLVGGQRLQSTSDFRPEWGLDYIMSFLELQAAGSKVQMYTKVAEAVDFFASVGADVNLSIMGKGQGWHIDENGNYVLDFSNVTGMDYDTAKALKDKYDNVQMILVGMNDTHIRLAIANSDIDFVIPWHSSGNSKDVISGLMSTFKETLENGHNYEDSQNDTFAENRTDEQKALWDARMKLLTKGGKALTEADRITLLSNPFTADLYKRFTEQGVDDDCYGVKLSKEQAKQIFPYEYWDTSLTKDQADENGNRFIKYCEAMGIVPRFSQFKNDKGYWKLLIDRPMYNNDGSYHQQQVIDVTNARIGDLNEAGQLENSDLPTQAQAKYAPKDPRNANYEKYTAAQQQAVENAEAMINERYDDGSEGQYSVYGDMTEADIALMEDVAEDYQSAANRGDAEDMMQDIEFALDTPVNQFNDNGLPVQLRSDGLVAIHNLPSKHIMKLLKMGGIAMPSTALIRSGTNWSNFGDVSIFLGKDIVNKTFSDSRAYMGDAFTPVVSHDMDSAQDMLTELRSYNDRNLWTNSLTSMFGSYRRINDLEEARAIGYKNEGRSDVDRGNITVELGNKEGKIIGLFDSTLAQHLMDAQGIDLKQANTIIGQNFDRIKSAYARGILEGTETIDKYIADGVRESKIDKEGIISDAVKDKLSELGIGFDGLNIENNQELMDAIFDFVNYATEKLGSDMMELKPNQIVRFSDASSILVPQDLPQEIIDALINSGVNPDRIFTYDKDATTGPSSREAMMKQIPSDVEGVQFSTGGDMTDADKELISKNISSQDVERIEKSANDAMNSAFAQEYDAWDKTSTGKLFDIGKPHSSLIKLGMPDVLLRISGEKINTILNDHHGMSDKIIKQIPNIIKDPIIIMPSNTVPGRITAFGEVMDEDGFPVLAALSTNVQKDYVENIEFTLMNSAYGKNYLLQNFLNKSHIIIVDEKRADSWAGSLRVEFPSTSTIIDSDGNIVPRNINSVNTVDGMVTYAEKSYLKESTIDQWLKDYAASNPNYAQAYIAYIDPNVFLDLTTVNMNSRRRIFDESKTFDEEQMQKISPDNPMFLRIDGKTGEIYGHEGRHRAVSMSRAGIKQVPILIFDFDSKYSKTYQDSLLIRGQSFSDGAKNRNKTTLHDVTPLSTGNRDSIIQKFSIDEDALRGKENDEQRVALYSIGGDRTAADEAMLNETLKNAGVLTQEQIDAYNEKTSRPLEGKSLKWSSTEGPADRAFGAEGGLLSQNDELAQRAVDYVMSHNKYFPDTNEEQIHRAMNWIGKNGFAKCFDSVTSKNFDYRSADGQARMVSMMAVAAAMGDDLGLHYQVQLADAFNRQGTDLGRALQSRKLFKLMTPAGRISLLQKMMNDQAQQFASKGMDVGELKFSDWVLQAAAYAESEEEFRQVQAAAAAELATQLPISWKERLNSLRMLSMLANPRTHIRNVVGNALFIPAVGLKNKIGAVLELGQKQGNKTKTFSLVLPSDIKQFAIDDAETMKGTLTGEAKYEQGTLVAKAKKPLGEVGTFLSELNGNLLEGEDWLFLKGHYRRALGGWMMANGYTVDQVKNDPALLEKGRAYAIEEAQKATYRDFNGVAKKLNELSRNPQTTGQKILGFGIDAVLPFKKTPANILKRGIEYSPIGLARGVANLARGFNNGTLTANQVIDRISSGLSGTAVMALGFLLSGTGAVSCGFDDDDWDEELKGRQKYSIRMNLFGRDVTYTMDWAAPMAMPFFVGAAIRDQADNEGWDFEKVLNAMSSITEPVFNLSMLDGVNSLLKVNSYSNENPMTQIFSKIATNYATSYVPSVLGAIARTIDGTQRKSFVTKGENTGFMGGVRYAWEQVENKLPGVSQTNIPVRDVWGNAKTSSFAERLIENFISPGYIEDYQNDPVVYELGRLFDSTQAKALEPKHADTSIKVGNETHNLDPQQFDTFDRVHGETQYKLLKELFNNRTYQQMTNDDAKTEIVSKVYEYANKVAKNAVFSEYTYDIETIESLMQSGLATEYSQKMMKALEQGDVQSYDDFLDAYADAVGDENEAYSKARDKIRDKYSKEYKQAYQLYLTTGEKQYEDKMVHIEELLDDSGFDFKIADWESDVEEKLGY